MKNIVGNTAHTGIKEGIKRIAKEHGFTNRGSACFRVIGDGVLQVIKYERITKQSYSACFGLHSMYSHLLPQWFTASHCIPNHLVERLQAMDCISMRHPDACNEYIERYIECQLQKLQEVLTYKLDKILTQSQLVETMCELNNVENGKIIWNDLEKFAPYLYIGEYNNAQRVLQSILAQHASAYESRRKMVGAQSTQDILTEYEKEEALKLNGLLDLVASRDVSKINDYLNNNYLQNVAYAKFCMK